MTWEMHITPQALAGLEPEVTVRVAVTTIRDGTQGVSLSTSTEVELSLSLEAGFPPASG